MADDNSPLRVIRTAWRAQGKIVQRKSGKAGSTFEPFVCEKEGLGPKAAQLVEHFVRKAQARTSVPYGVMKSYCYAPH